MAEEHGQANVGGGAHPSLGNKLTMNMRNMFKDWYNFYGQFQQRRGKGYWKQLTLEPEEERGLTGAEEILVEEGIKKEHETKITGLRQIEDFWKAIENKREELEKLYKDISHYTTTEKITDEIHLLEFGTNVEVPKEQGDYEYISETEGNELIITDGTREIKIKSLAQLVQLFRSTDGQRYFTLVKDKIKDWITNELELPKVAAQVKVDNLQRFLESVVVKVPKYSHLRINPVTRMHFGGGDLIRPSDAEQPIVINSKKYYKLKDVYELANTNPNIFENFISNQNQKYLLVDWIAKEIGRWNGKQIGLRHLATLAANVNTAAEFKALFPKGVDNYREPQYLEQLAFFGYYRLKEIIPKIDSIQQRVQKWELTPEIRKKGIQDVKKTDVLAALKGIQELLTAVNTVEKNYKVHISDTYFQHTKQVEDKWPDLFKRGSAPEHLHFMHTYETTKVYNLNFETKKMWKVKYTNDVGEDDEKLVSNDEYNRLNLKDEAPAEETEIKGSAKIEFFEDKHPGFKRPEEFSSGVDERAMPLEVYIHSDGSYYVLVDYWFYKIAQNKWQMQTILDKIGEKKFRELFNDRADFNDSLEIGEPDKNGKRSTKPFKFELSPLYNKGNGRKVNPGFHDKIDILEVINYLNTNWDAYRDDWRDGRFHPKSKTFFDYVFAAHRYRMTTPEHEAKWKWRGEICIPITPITTKMTGWEPDHWKRKPLDRKKLPKDEQKITSEFVMEYNQKKADGSYEVRSLYKDSANKEKYSRAPTHMNPAFDRTALAVPEEEHGHGNKHSVTDENKENSANESENHESEHANSTEESVVSRDGAPAGAKYIHWGRMYYYEDTDGINKYSENPDTSIGTRGIGKYIIDRAIRQSFTLKEMMRTIDNMGPYDLGIRGQGKPMIENPLRGAQGKDRVIRVK